MTDRKICKKIVKAGSCFDLEDICCSTCPLNDQNCNFTKSFGRATQWLKDHPKIKKDFSKITTEQLETAINYYKNKKAENKRGNTILRDCCMGITCKNCPFYDKEKDVVCSVSNEKIQKAFRKELKRRKEAPLKELFKNCTVYDFYDWSNFSTEQLFEAVDSYIRKEFGVGTHPCKGLNCPDCPYYDSSAIKCIQDYKTVHEAHVKEMNRRLAENEGKEDKEFLPKTLTLKEIVSKWWEIDENKYAKVSMVNTSDNNILNGDILFCFEGIADNVVKYVRDSKGNAIRSFVDRDWFEHHESFDFPPEN